MFCQSITIARFLAKRAGLYGDTELEQTYADMIVDCATDFNNSKWIASGSPYVDGKVTPNCLKPT